MAWIASRDARSADEVRRHDRAIRDIMINIAADAWVLCEVVAAGPLRWRRSFLATMRAAGLPLATEEIADRLYAFFCLRVQAMAGSDQPSPALAGHFLDQLEVHERRVPTEREIAESWTVESASSAEGQAFAYGGQTKDEAIRALQGDDHRTFAHES